MKRINKTIYKTLIVWMMIVITVIGTISPPVYGAAEDSGRTVRVAVFPLGSFQNWNRNGNAYGYNIDYLNKLATITHWKYEYVEAQNFQDACELLRNDKVDLVAPAQFREYLREEFAYSTYTMAIESAAIFVLDNDQHEDILYEDFESMSQMTFGMVKYGSSSFTDSFIDDYTKKNKFEPQSIKFYENMTEVLGALNSGEVDAAVTNILFTSNKYKLLARYSPLTSYYIMQQDNKGLKDELDTAMCNLLLSEPSYQTELMSDYFQFFGITEFTYDEKQFLKDLPTIRVGYYQNRSPISYTDDNGEFAGISRRVMDKVAKTCGITFEYVPLPSENMGRDYYKENDIHIICTGEHSESLINEEGTSVSSPYLQSDTVVVLENDKTIDSKSDITVGFVSNSYSIQENVKKEYPNLKLKVFSSLEEAFDAVANNKIEGLIDNRYSVERLLTKPQYSSLNVFALQGIEDEICVATRAFDGDDDEMNAIVLDPRFIAIIDKGIKNVTKIQKTRIIIDETAKSRYVNTFFDFCFQYRYLLSICICLLLIIMLLLFQARQIEVAKARELGIKNKQLAEAVEAADKANAAKTQFLARMSHEIRTPMNAIIGESTLIEKHIMNTERVENYNSKILTSAKHLLNLINDILDMAAIESKKIKIAEAPFDIKEIVKTAITLYYSQCKRKGIDFKVILDKVDHEVLVGDQLRLQQVILNILSNAYKFTEPGGTITLKLAQMDEGTNKTRLNITIKDTGCGMSEEYMDRMFKPFEQENALTASEHGGSGLGLSISKNLTELMGGEIKVDSKVGEGTTIFITVPLVLGDDAFGSSTFQIPKLTAFVVDDDLGDLEYASSVLDSLGIEHHCEHDVQKAIDELTKARNDGHPYDVCLVDWLMDGMNGEEFVRRIRKTYSDSTIVIVATAYDTNQIVDVAIDAGADECVDKPLFPSTFFNMMMKEAKGKLFKGPNKNTNYDFCGKRILVVDDTEINREIVTELLEWVHAEVDCARDGQEALEMFEASKPGTYDCILMDVQMPVMNGYEATKAIRASNHPQAKDIVIIAATANAFAEDIDNSLKAGMNDHISKPIEAELMYQVLGRWLNVFKS